MWSIEDIFSTLLADQQVVYALKAKVFCGTSVNIVYYYYTFFPYYSAKSFCHRSRVLVVDVLNDHHHLMRCGFRK